MDKYTDKLPGKLADKSFTGFRWVDDTCQQIASISNNCCDHPDISISEYTVRMTLVIECRNCGNAKESVGRESSQELIDRWDRYFYKRNSNNDFNDLPMELMSM